MSPDSGGDEIYIVGYNRDEDEEELDKPFTQRCMFHAEAVKRLILALGNYIDYKDLVAESISDFDTKYGDKYYE
jgi:hypothetical protein